MTNRRVRRRSKAGEGTPGVEASNAVPAPVTEARAAAAVLPQVGFLVLLCLGLALPTLWFGFVWDDPYLISSNHLVTGPFSFRGLMSSTLVLKQLPMPFYRPVQMLVHAIEFSVFGLQAWGYHLVGAFLHTSVVLLVFLVGKRLFPSPWAAFTGAVFFAIHPVHAEAVSFISAHGDLLSTLFALLAFAAVMAAARAATFRGAVAAAAATAMAYLAAMLSKETPILLPVVFLMYLLYEPEPAERSPTRARTSAVLAIAMGVGGLLYLWLRNHAAAPMGGTGAALDPGGALRRFASYTRLLVDPTSIRMYWPAVPAGWSRSSLIGILLVLGGSFLAVFPGAGRSRRVLLWLWFSLALLPSLKIVPFPGTDLAARYAYLPSVAAAWAVAMIHPSLIEVLTTKKARKAALAVAVLLGSTLVLAWYREQSGWKDRIQLYSRMAADAPEFAMVHFNLANSLSEAGRKDEAAREYRTALRLKPDYADAHFNLGRLLMENSSGDPVEADTHLRAYLALRPQAPDREFTLSMIRALGARVPSGPGKEMR